MKDLVRELLGKKVVFVPFAEVRTFVMECESCGINAFGGAFLEEGQFFYTE